jgi:carbon starvation protein CstA
MEFVPLLAAAALVVSALNLVKFVKNRDWNGTVSTGAAWVIGVGVTLLLAESDFAESIAIGDTGQNLATANTFSLILVGVTFAAVAQQLYDYKRALDQTDSAMVEPLVKNE